MPELHPDVAKVRISEEEINAIVERLGAEITRDYADKNPLVVTVLRGAFVFTADLVRAIKCPCAVDFMAVSSYGDGVKSSGVVRIVKDLDRNIENKDVLIVEDIVDSGRTLSYLVKVLEQRHPASIRIATLLDKPARRVVDLTVQYSCFDIPDAFVVGYGLDYDEKYRNLPDIGVLSPKIYESES